MSNNGKDFLLAVWSSHGPPVQNEPEDLTVKSPEVGKKFSLEEYRRESLELLKAKEEELKHSRQSECERSDGSSHSPSRIRLDEADDEDEDDRGVSPPLSHPPLYNPLFSNSASIQLGLAGAALGIPPRRFNGDSESDRLPLVAQKEISQQ